MRGRNVHPKTSRRAREFAEHHADEFDANVVANAISEAFIEDDQLVDVLDLTYRAQDAANRRETEMHDGHHDEHVRTLEAAADDIYSITTPRRMEIVAEACLTVLREVEQIREHYKPEVVEAALDEAVAWLTEHHDVAARVDVDWSSTVAEAAGVDVDEVRR